MQKNNETADGVAKCIGCGSESDDPAVQDEPVREFLSLGGCFCAWCRLPASSFVSSRTLPVDMSEGPYGGLPQELELPKSLKPVEAELFSFEQKGQLFGAVWRDYYIRYGGLIIAEGLEPHDEHLPAWLMRHPAQRQKVVWLTYIRIFYRKSISFVEVVCLPSNSGVDHLTSIQRLEETTSTRELSALWRGFALFKTAAPRCRPLGTGNLENISIEELVALNGYLRIKHEENNLPPPTYADIAAYYGVSERTLYNRRVTLNIVSGTGRTAFERRVLEAQTEEFRMRVDTALSSRQKKQ